MDTQFSRRAVLGALLGSAATASWAQAPATSLRPVARPLAAGTITPEMRLGLADVIAASGVSGRVGVVVSDAKTGAVLESHDAALGLPPASVTKAVTALYAMESLGAEFTFITRLIADGPIKDGVLDGNLILAGGGDPNLVTDHLADLAAMLKATGLTAVRGNFYVYDNALPNLDEIDDSQLDYLGYNPAVTGLNLNFNRVHFEWKRAGGTYTVTMDARSASYRPVVTMAKMRVVDRSSPVFTYRDGGGLDEWTVARGALGTGGSRWLPVRYPALYAGEVFAGFARSNGLVLTPPTEIAVLPEGTEIARYRSEDLRRMMRDMLRYSTNITAEAAGMAGTEARTGQKRELRTSALGMTQWTRTRAGIAPMFADHSGLGDTTRLSAADMVTLLNADGVADVLRPLLKDIPLRDDNRKVIKDHGAQVVAKTGTLNFVSCLAGFMRTKGGRDLTFAIFAADLDARALGKVSNDEQPAGSITFNTRAKTLQQQLLRRWAAVNTV